MLYDDPPHRVTLKSSANTKGAGGGNVISYTTQQSDVPCLINTIGASQALVYAQMQIRVTHTVGILSSELTTTPQPGWKIEDETGKTYLFKGIRSGRVSALGTIPALTYLDCEQWL